MKNVISSQPISIFQYSSNTVEMDLLICCSRTYINSNISKKIKLLIEANIDWNLLIKLASLHGVIPLVYQTLKCIGSETIPKDILMDLKRYSYIISANNILFFKELTEVIDLFKKNDILSISFKGPILAGSAYKNLGLRHFCDLDILVKKKDFLKAFDLLINRGYEPSFEWNLLNLDLEILLRSSKAEYSLKKDGFIIDLHQSLTVENFLASEFTFEYLWNRRESVSVSGHIIDSFGAEDLIMYLCIHGSKDCWRNLKWICDISEYINFNSEINWDKLLKQAKILGCERMLLLGLLITNVVFDTSLPKIVLEKISIDNTCQKLAEKFQKRLFSFENNLNRKFTLEKFIIHLRMVERFEDKLSCIQDLGRPIYGLSTKLIPNIEDYRFFPLPEPLFFLYYLIKPIRLVALKLKLTKTQK